MRTAYMRISSLNRVVRARLLTFCLFGRISMPLFVGGPGRSMFIVFRSNFRSASRCNTFSFRSRNSFGPLSDGSPGVSFLHEGQVAEPVWCTI